MASGKEGGSLIDLSWAGKEPPDLLFPVGCVRGEVDEQLKTESLNYVAGCVKSSEDDRFLEFEALGDLKLF